MKNPIAALQARLANIRSERGASDPMLIIAGISITLALLIGGTFLITQATDNAKDLNATSDLDKVSVAEASVYGQNDGFVAYGSFGVASNTSLESTGLGFRPTEGASIVVLLNPGSSTAAWAGASQSLASGGTIFIRTSESNVTLKYDNSGAYLSSNKDTKTAGEAKLGLNAAGVAALVAAVKAEK